MKNLRWGFVVGVIAAAWSGGCTSKTEKATVPSLPYYHTADFTPYWFSSSEGLDTLHHLQTFRFRNQNNKWISSDTLRGKIHVANFFFTSCPSLCPRLTQSMKEVQQAFRNDANVTLMSFSVLPEHDSVQVLRAYATQYQVSDAQWNLLTGDRKSIYETARKSYFADENLGVQKGENDFLHTENFILVDKNLRIRGIYNGTLPLEIKQLIEDIKVLEAEGE